MGFAKIKSWAKINLTINVIKRFPNKYHSIESLITFVKVFDLIKIRKWDEKHHKISFSGKFSKGISKNNTVYKLLNLLEKRKIIKNTKFKIDIEKNIPQKSGMGGGSMNAASIMSHLMKKGIIKISNKKARELAYKVGYDVVLGLEKKNSILFKNKKIGRLNKKINLYVLIAKPNHGCDAKYIFSRVKKYSKSLYYKINKHYFDTNYLTKSNNDLENIVMRKYSKIKKIKYFLSGQKNVIFTRMTGTGSAVVAYFKTKKSANNAAKVFKSKYKNYWYIVSKTI